jgi:hypothetical protein
MAVTHKLFEENEITELTDENRLASATEGQSGSDFILFSNFIAQLKSIFNKRTPIIDKGTSDSVTFSLADDAVQKVMPETSSLTIAFSNLPTDYSTTNLLRLTANVGVSVTVTFTGLTEANWVDNSPLPIMSDNCVYEISITTFGSNLSDATLGWVKIGA